MNSMPVEHQQPDVYIHIYCGLSLCSSLSFCNESRSNPKSTLFEENADVTTANVDLLLNVPFPFVLNRS